MKEWNIAVVGATGAVGQELLQLLEQRAFPAGTVKLLASPSSVGRRISVFGSEWMVEAISAEAFKGIDIAFFCAGGSISREWMETAVQAGALCIDNTSAFRMEEAVPLIVPEVNGDRIPEHGIVSNPNCSTILMALALKPLDDAFGLRRVVVSTYQAVSGAGARAMQELEDQVRSYVTGESAEAKVLPAADDPKHYPIAFNAIPQIDSFGEDGYTKEEWKMVRETRKIFENPALAITATTVRLPIFRSHCESLNIELRQPATVQQCCALLQQAPGVEVMDDPSQQVYPMPLYTSHRDPVFVGRIRKDPTVAHGINLWLVGDQIRKGAALNALQIAETWSNRRS